MADEQLMEAVSRHDYEGVCRALTTTEQGKGGNPNYCRAIIEPHEAGCAQPTTPLCLVLFRLSDCMLTEVEQAEFVRIAHLLLAWDADPEPAVEIAEQRYGEFVDCSNDTDKVSSLNVVRGLLIAAAVERRKMRHGARCSDISGVKAVRFCGSMNRRYNVWSDVCCWVVTEIEDYPADLPNPITREPFKGEAFGLTCWEVLEWFSYDMHMDMISFNGVHPYTDKDGRLYYERDEKKQKPRFFVQSDVGKDVDKSWTMERQLEIFRTRPDNLLQTLLRQVHPQADVTRVTHIACRGKWSGKAFPSNIIGMLHLPVTLDSTPVPPEIFANHHKYDLASMPVELQLLLITCQRYTMIPAKILRDVGLILTYTLGTETLTVHVGLDLCDSFHTGFREFRVGSRLVIGRR